MNSLKLVILLHFDLCKKSFSVNSRKSNLPNTIRAVTPLIIFGKMQFLLISENEFDEIKRDGVTSFLDFMFDVFLQKDRTILSSHMAHCSIPPEQ